MGVLRYCRTGAIFTNLAGIFDASVICTVLYHVQVEVTVSRQGDINNGLQATELKDRYPG